MTTSFYRMTQKARLIWPAWVMVGCMMVFFTGCATVQDVSVLSAEKPGSSGVQNILTEEESLVVPETVTGGEVGQAADLENIKKKEKAAPAGKKGIVFAKTIFQGVLKKEFVRLMIQSVENPEQTFRLHIGEKTAKALPWGNVKTVKPGYFFIELPAGSYKVSSISIPVGSALATEEMNIRFDVVPDKVTYMGTLDVIGTKEKVKLGGVPVFQPGFEYEAQIINERENALEAFHQRYPDLSQDVLVHLMTLSGN